tara:strand:+ start:1341 stop:1652 length:312 start_codon:yes stop_codon:yes gene_type:complete
MDYLASVLVWIMAVYGMTTIIVSSTIMQPVRNVISSWIPPLGKLVNCMLCMGFWAGVFWGTLYWNPFSQAEGHWLLHALFSGCLGSATTWLMYLKVYPLMHGK